MPLKPKSLAARLLLASALLLPVFLGLSGYMLDLAFQRSLLAAEQERLNTHVYLLLAAAELQGDTLWLPEQLTEPRFGQVDSGLYGFITNMQHAEIWRSASAGLLTAVPDIPEVISPGQTGFETVQLSNTQFYLFYYDVAWESDQNKVQNYRFAVLHEQTEFRAELAAYRGQLGWLLGSVGFLLIIAQTLIMRWGLRPLSTLADHLRSVEQGQTTRLEGQYPREIQPVTDNLNRVLHAERTQRERYRHTLADLAHSLKTPLAVMRGALNDNNNTPTPLLDEQLTRMDQIISHQLQRAVVSSSTRPGQRVDVHMVIERLSNALQKIHSGKQVEIIKHYDAAAYFHGDEPDLLEMLGNILENAFKYGTEKIQVTVEENDRTLTIMIADDGPGIAEDMQTQILKRGARADTARPGHGIGLAVAVDIISSYQGSLEIRQSEMGGAEFVIVLPRLN